MDNDFEAMVERLSAESAIRQLIYRHCRALDRCDSEALLSLYHDDALHVQGPFRGLAAQFVNGALAKVRTIGYGSHHITNMVIDLHGDMAKVESYYLGFARVRRDENGLPWDRIVTGRNLDIIARRDGQWKIASRYVLYDSNQLVRGSADADDPNLSHYTPWGRRDETDVSIRFHDAAPDTAESWWDK